MFVTREKKSTERGQKTILRLYYTKYFFQLQFNEYVDLHIINKRLLNFTCINIFRVHSMGVNLLFCKFDGNTIRNLQFRSRM